MTIIDISKKWDDERKEKLENYKNKLIKYQQDFLYYLLEFEKAYDWSNWNWFKKGTSLISFYGIPYYSAYCLMPLLKQNIFLCGKLILITKEIIRRLE